MSDGVVMLVMAVLAVPVLLVVALVMLLRLRERVSTLEQEVSWLRSSVDQARAPAPSPREAFAREVVRAPEPEPEPLRDPVPPPVQPPVPSAWETSAADTPAPVPGRASYVPGRDPVTPTLPPVPPPPVYARPEAPTLRRERIVRPDPIELAVRAVRRWFTEGNVPVKVGVLVLFAGVAALLKYASDQGWVRVPTEVRVAGVALAAIGMLIFGWKQREERRSFALSLQGGAIGVLLMVAFAASKTLGLIPAPAAFALSVILVAGTGVLAVLQNARALAVLGILAGFLAPIWLSTGQGSHVALFSYYALLNAGILAIAWKRAWRVLNLMGFAFTFGIGTAWGVLQYHADQFGSTEPFLLLFFAFYLVIPLLYARQRAPGRRDFVDSCLLFGTPLVAFSLQAALLRDQPLALAFCALGLAALYALLATLTRTREHFAPLLAPYAALALGLATLAVPLALSARATASIFALEGAGALWLGLRQQRRWPQVAGIGLQLAAAVAFVVGGSAYSPHVAIANPYFMSMLLIALAGFVSARSAQHAGLRMPAGLAYAWGLAWWCVAGIGEIGTYVAHGQQAHAVLMFVAATALLAGEAHRRWPGAALAWTVVAAQATGIVVALATHDEPWQNLGLVAWLVFAACGARALRSLHAQCDERLPLAHGAWAASLLLFAMVCLQWLANRFDLGDGWRIALTGLPWLLALAATLWRPQWMGQPVAEAFDGWREHWARVLMVVLGLGWLLALENAGDSTPLAWLPLLNPLDLAQLAVLGLFAHWLYRGTAPAAMVERRAQWLAGAAFVLVSVITLRAAHHLGGEPWGPGLVDSNLVQTSLTVVWSLLGVLGWILGSRRQQRGLWLAGAVLMGVVLAKLLLVDRQHLGNLLGILSFMAYGVLCTAVGYFAPAPPRNTETAA